MMFTAKLLTAAPKRWTRKQVQDMLQRDSDQGKWSLIWDAADEDNMEAIERMVDDAMGSGPVKPILDWIGQHCPKLLETAGRGEDELLLRKLLQLGGRRSEPSGEAMSQLQNDPDCEFILRNGQEWGSAQIHEIMAEGACHWNTSELFLAGKVEAVVIGYAVGPEGLAHGEWHQHTWGLRGGQVVETTESNTSATKYFGAVLSRDQAERFAKKCKKRKRGMGMIRTYQGGANA